VYTDAAYGHTHTTQSTTSAPHLIHFLIYVIDVAAFDRVGRKEHSQLGHNDTVAQRTLQLRGGGQLDLQARLNPPECAVKTMCVFARAAFVLSVQRKRERGALRML